MSDTTWLKNHRETQTRMVKFEFKKFFEDYDLSLEQFAKTIGYSVYGVEAMIKRGTIKRNIFTLLQSIYHIDKLSKYVK